MYGLRTRSLVSFATAGRDKAGLPTEASAKVGVRETALSSLVSNTPAPFVNNIDATLLPQGVVSGR